MSTETMDRPIDPNAGSEPVGAWRIADGKIVRGRGRGGSEQRETLAGSIESVYTQLVHDGVNDKDKTYIGVVLKNTEGAHSVHTSSMSTAMGLMRAMLDCGPGKPVVIVPKLADKPNKFGAFNTYANVYALNPANGQRGASLGSYDKEDTFESLLDAFQTLPFYKERVRGETHTEEGEKVDNLDAEIDLHCKRLGWPTPTENEKGWIEIASEISGTDELMWDAVGPEAKKAIRDSVADAPDGEELPDELKPAKRKLGKAA